MSEQRPRRAACPGSFDPVTNGHLDVIGRASALYDEVVVAVLVNESKVGLFTVDERIEMLTEVTAAYPNVSVRKFRGLLVDFCRANAIPVVIKGLRVASDFDYELQMAQMNRELTGVDTIFMPTAPQWSYVSSTLIREIAGLGGDVAAFLPPRIAERIRSRVAEREGEKPP